VVANGSHFRFTLNKQLAASKNTLFNLENNKFSPSENILFKNISFCLLGACSSTSKYLIYYCKNNKNTYKIKKKQFAAVHKFIIYL